MRILSNMNNLIIMQYNNNKSSFYSRYMRNTTSHSQLEIAYLRIGSHEKKDRHYIDKQPT